MNTPDAPDGFTWRLRCDGCGLLLPNPRSWAAHLLTDDHFRRARLLTDAALQLVDDLLDELDQVPADDAAAFDLAARHGLLTDDDGDDSPDVPGWIHPHDRREP